MTADGLTRVNGVESKYYLGLFNNNVNRADIQKNMEENLFFANISFRDNLLRISGATLKIQSTGDMAYIFITFVLILTGFLLVLVTNKRMNLEKKQIGVLEAMGYSSNKIAISYIIYGVSVGFIGSALGVLVDYLAYPSMMSIYAQFYNIPFNNQSPNIGILLELILITTLVLGIVTYFFALSMSKKEPLRLLHDVESMKISWFSRGVHKITKKLSFKKRFKYNTASRSISRIMGVFFGVFSAGLLIMLFFVGSTMVNSLINEGIKGEHYNYETIYKTTIAENQLPLQQGDEPFVLFKADPMEISRQGKNIPIPSNIGDSATSEKQVIGVYHRLVNY